MGEALQTFFESTVGIAITAAVIIVLMLFIMRGSPGENKRNDVKALTFSALMVALTMILDQIKLFSMPQGGSVSLMKMLPIVLVGYYFGTKRGLMAGFSVGLLQLILGPYVIHPVQLLLDYPLAYGALGISGFFRNSKNGLIKGYLLGVLGRYVCAFLSGAVFFPEYAPEGWNGIVWSLWYNFTYIAAEAVITLIVLNIPPVKKALNSLLADRLSY